MKKQRNLESRSQNRYKQDRKQQRRAKHQEHRHYLIARLNQLHNALDLPLPPDWAILYPELQDSFGHSQWQTTLWSLHQSAPLWFARLPKGSSSEVELVLLAASVRDAQLGENFLDPHVENRRRTPSQG